MVETESQNLPALRPLSILTMKQGQVATKQKKEATPLGWVTPPDNRIRGNTG
jgi:hypothetical protein